MCPTNFALRLMAFRPMTIFFTQGDEYMDKETEREIVSCFLKKEKQERILWELQSRKKRSQVMWKICDTTLIDERCIHKVSYSSAEELIEECKKRGASMKPYIFRLDYIGSLPQDISIPHAIEMVMDGWWNPCLLYLGNGVAYFQGMQEKGAPERCILLSKNKK